ncbi:CDP-alcohol phosphatidyltransferase family protein [Patescibacteria group bacterium]|nr:CDP-alcohol phosphatidyltransferase family protein [Patescibacteria group bacterium]
MKRLPNLLGYARIVLTPAVMALVLYWNNELWVGLLFAVVVATDGFDGLIARATHSVTQFGKMLDTTADKFLIAGMMIALTAKDPIWAWPAFIIIGREFLVVVLKGKVGDDLPGAFWLGKIKMGFQSVAIYLIINPWPFESATGWHSPGGVVMGVAIFFTLLSGLVYFVKYGEYLWPKENLS